MLGSKDFKRGFTIFFAVLVASLSLTVGLVIYDILIRSLSLSDLAKQSQYAIYAADSGAECALYWDIKYSSVSSSDADSSAFATSTKMVPSDTGAAAAANTVVCNGQDIVAGAAPKSTAWAIAYPASGVYLNRAATTTFWFSMGTALTSACAQVEVGKAGNPSRTTIISHGYNNCIVNNPIKLERTLQISF
jgi:hypothetical protein